MNKRPKSAQYFCKKCGCIEIIPNNQDKIKLSQITAVYCPICACKGRKVKMVKVKEELKGGKRK